MWPWLMILAGTVLIIGALVARHRMLSDYRAQLEQAERAARRDRTQPETSTAEPGVTATAASARPATLVTGTTSTSATAVPHPVTSVTSPATPPRSTGSAPIPAFALAARPAAPTTRREVKAARAAGQPVVTGPPPLFADLPVGHRLTAAPTVRVRSQDVPLQDWLRYHAEFGAWSGVIQSISDRITGDPLLQPYVGTMDRATLQHHVMSTVMMLTGEGVTVGAVRRLADAHLHHVRSGGEPVTEPVWNRMAATVGNALREHDAPEAAILSLNTTVAPLRSVIVTRDTA